MTKPEQPDELGSRGDSEGTPGQESGEKMSKKTNFGLDRDTILGFTPFEPRPTVYAKVLLEFCGLVYPVGTPVELISYKSDADSGRGSYIGRIETEDTIHRFCGGSGDFDALPIPDGYVPPEKWGVEITRPVKVKPETRKKNTHQADTSTDWERRALDLAGQLEDVKSKNTALSECLKETAEELLCWIEEESPSLLLQSNPRYLITMDKSYRLLAQIGMPCQWEYPEPDESGESQPGYFVQNERQALIDKGVQLVVERDTLKAELGQHRNTIKAMLKAQEIGEGE